MKVIITLMIIFWLWGVFSVANAQVTTGEILALPGTPTTVYGTGTSIPIDDSGTLTSISAYFRCANSGGNDCSSTDIYLQMFQTNNIGEGPGSAGAVLLDCVSPVNTGTGFGMSSAFNPPDTFIQINFSGSECDLDNSLFYGFQAYRASDDVVTGLISVGGDGGFFNSFYMNGSGGGPSIFTTRLRGGYEPDQGAFYPATSTAVTLGFEYTAGIPQVNEVGVEYRNLGTSFAYTPQFAPVTINGDWSFSTTTPVLPSGVYQWRAVLTTDLLNYYSPWRLFSVGTSPDQSFIPIPDDAEFGCEEGNWLSNTLCSFMAWAFIPPATTMNGVLEIWQGLRDVKPFGYIVQVIDLRGSMQLTDPNYTLGTLPLQDAIFDPLRAGIAVLLWVFFLFYLYNRFKSMDI